MPRTARVSLLLVLLSLVGCATLPPNAQRDARDPWERMNRATFKFNDSVDRHVYRPVAVGYTKVVPLRVRTSVSNFLDNLSYPVTIVNDLLQLKVVQFGRDTTRFLVNTTVGVGGLFDPAGASGLEKNQEDLGQTFGHWGAGPGPYIVVPLLGPSDVRDGLGRIGDIWLDPRHYISNSYISYGLWGIDLIDIRARLLTADQALEGAYDRYAFLRNAYLQRRQYLINSGKSNAEQSDKSQYEEERKILEESEGAPEQPRQDEARPQTSPPPKR